MKLTSIAGKFSFLNKSTIVEIKQAHCLTTATTTVVNIIIKIMYFKGISAVLNDCVHLLSKQQIINVIILATDSIIFFPGEYENMFTILISDLNIYVISKSFYSFLFVIF